VEEDLRRALTAIVDTARESYPSDVDYPFDPAERRQSANVQTALRSLGYECTLSDAAGLWEMYSNAYQAQWLDGPDTVERALDAIRAFAEARLRGDV
jgi:hypothetical protein